jgi:ABC-type sugar transport system ATPase subunit
MQPILEMRNISKKFPGVLALNDVSLLIQPGEIHSIVGENGAGKSTLMKILSGVYQRNSGSILIRDEEVEIKNPQAAIDLGIGTVYQNLDLIPDLSVAENIFMNQFITSYKGVLNYRSMEKRAADVLAMLDCTISPKMKVGSLSVADQQLVAIARVLSRDISVLILDEPTSSLNQYEAEQLFGNVRRLKESGVATIFISHHMEEIFAVAERVTVLRDGEYIGTWGIEDLTENSLVHHMVGREITDVFPKTEVEIGEELLRAEHISVENKVHDISFSLRKGEILGISGLVGAGRSELVKALFGAIKKTSGEIFIDGTKVTIEHPIEAVNLGMAFIPEDRHEEGLILNLSILENIGLCNLKKISRAGVISNEKERDMTRKIITEMMVKTPSEKQTVENLSGGNQQKVVLGKWFTTNPRIMIFDEPTKGIDVGAKSEIHKKIGELAKKSLGIIVVSSELPELLGISDRILVLSKGRKVKEFTREDFDAEQIMLAASSDNIA